MTEMKSYVELTGWNKFVMVSNDLHEGMWQPSDDEHSEYDHQHANHLQQTTFVNRSFFRVEC